MSRYRHHLLAVGLYTLLTIIITYPLLPNITTHVIGGWRMDNYEYVWKMWWVPHAIFDLGISPWVQPNIYYPFGYQLAYGEITPVHTFFMMPVTRIFGEIVSYNLAMLGSTILTGWSMYWLARRWLAQLRPQADARLLFVAAFYAGAALAFSVSRIFKLTGHLPLVDMHWLVLAILYFDLWLENRRLRDAALSGFMIALAALSSWYFALMLMLILPVYALVRCGWRLLLDWRTYRAGGLVAVIVAVLCLPFLLPYLSLNAGGAVAVPIEDASFWAASPTDYLIPNALHPLWGSLFQPLAWPFSPEVVAEFIIPVGWVTLLLALFASRQTRSSRWRALKWAMGIAFILSLGPYLYLSRLPLNIPLPTLLLRQVLPFAAGLRTWGRFSIIVMIGFSLLAAVGLMLAMERRSPRIRLGVGAFAVMLMLFGSWTGPMALTPVAPRAVDRWLAEQPDTHPVMEYPLSIALSGPSMLYTRYHGKPIVFGYGTYLPLFYRQRHPDLLTFPGDPALDQLAAWGVHFILVTPYTLVNESYSLADIDAQQRLRRVTAVEDIVVYELIH
jgi:hypothetical protein